MTLVTRKDSILLDNVSSKDIDIYLEQRFSSSYSNLEKIHEDENELQYITKYQGNKVTLYLWRESHNPYSLQLKVEFNSNKSISQSRSAYNSRYIGSGSRNFFFIIILLMLARILFPVILLFLFEPIGIFLLFGLVITFFYLRRKPNTERGNYKKQGVQAEHFLMQVKAILSEMKAVDATNKKCWNCFEPVDPTDNVCAICGKSQR